MWWLGGFKHVKSSAKQSGRQKCCQYAGYSANRKALPEQKSQTIVASLYRRIKKTTELLNEVMASHV
jgi:hypothetical protein